jgi:hypothetical protein
MQPSEDPGPGRGGINVADLVIGLVLIPVVAAIFYVFAGMVWGKPEVIQDKAEVNPPPDGEEVDACWKQIQELFKNAKYLADMAGNVEDLNLKDHFRRWRDQCFQGVDKKILDLEVFIRSYAPKHPDIEKTFGSYLGEGASLRRLVASELGKAKESDAKKDAGK